MDDANELLMGGGGKAAKFPDRMYGTTVGGIILGEPEKRQQTDFDTGKPLTWDDGNPRWQVVITLQTDERDPSDVDDRGERKVYARGQMLMAIRDACKAANAPKGIATGGRLTITYLRDEPNSKGRGNDRKVYSASYMPPGNVAMMNGSPAAPVANAFGPSGAFVAAPQQVAYAPTPNGGSFTPQLPQPSNAEAAARIAPVVNAQAPAGVDQTVWDRMAPEQRQLVLAAVGATAPF